MGGIAGALISPLATLLFRQKAPKPQAQPRPVMQRSDTVAADALSRRRGSRANQRSGRGGAEAGGAGGKTKLGG